MTIQERLTQIEKAELAYWLAPLPKTEFHTPATKTNTSQDQGTIRTPAIDNSQLPDLGPLEQKFNSWESVAATINRKATELSNYNPASTTFDQTSWDAYKYRLSSAPFWLTTINRYREAQITSLDLSQAVNAVKDIVLAIVTENSFNAIQTGIRKIAELAVNNAGKTNKENYQEQGILSVKDSTLYVGLIRTYVEMSYKSGKGYEQLNQYISVQAFYGSLDFDKCKRSSETILKWDLENLDQWINTGNSQNEQPNTSPAWKN